MIAFWYGGSVFRSATDYRGPIPPQLDRLYFAAEWDGWLGDMSTELRLRNRPGVGESVF